MKWCSDSTHTYFLYVDLIAAAMFERISRDDSMTTSTSQLLSSFPEYLPREHHFSMEVHQSVNVQVEKLSYRVGRQRVSKLQNWLATNALLPTSCIDDTKLVLDDISFTVKSGQMLAILGSSGSGKTSLLDVISYRNKTGQVTGKVFLNGTERTPSMIDSCAVYVRQDDRLMASLTVRETLLFVAQLRLPRTCCMEDIQARVDGVILELGLKDVADTKIGSAEIRGISGGERRRVSIGIQMLIDPSLLFLDEPTSGLDSFTASYLVSTLSQLAHNRRTILMTLHQPRSSIFELFDLIMIMSGGRIVYFGKAVNMVSYFTRLGYPCPQLANPCDFYVDLTTIDHTADDTEEITERVVASLQNSYFFYEATNREDVTADDSMVATRMTPIVPLNIYPGRWRQFSVLFRRMMRSEVEDKHLLAVRSAQALAMSLLLGVVYWKMQDTQDSIRDHFGLLYMVCVMFTYLIILDVVETCHKERKQLYYETQDHLYTKEAYFLAKIASDLPVNICYILLYVCPVYFLTSMPLDPASFLQIFTIMFLIVFCTRAMAMMSAAVCPTFQSSCFFAQCVFSIFLMSSGFFINLDNILSELKWISTISYVRWGFQGMCLVDIAPRNFSCEGEIIPGSCVHDGDAALKMFAFDEGTTWLSFTALTATLVIFLVLKYLAFRLIPQTPEEHI